MTGVLPFSDEHSLSEGIYDSVMNGRLADSRDRKTKIDFKFFKMAWCYDIKCKKGIEIIRENGYVDAMYQDIDSPDENMRMAYEKVKEYLDHPVQAMR